MKKLSDEKIVEIRELTKAGASVRITSALTGASIGSISHYTDDIDKSPHVRKQSYIQPVKRQMAKAVPVYTRRQPSSYIDQVRIAPPSGRIVVADKPVVPLKPPTKIQKERKDFKDRDGIDVSWVKKENEERRRKNEEIEYRNQKDIKQSEYNKQYDQSLRDIYLLQIQNNQVKEREKFELDYPINPENRLTEKRVRSIIQDTMKIDKEKKHKICMAYSNLRTIQNGEIYRVKKKQINDKFIEDITPSVLAFIGDIAKSIILIRKIPPKKPLQARVIS